MSPSLHTPGLSPNPLSNPPRDYVREFLHLIAKDVANHVMAGDIPMEDINAAIQLTQKRSEIREKLCNDPSNIPVSCLARTIYIAGLEYRKPWIADATLTKVIDRMFFRTALTSTTHFVIPAKTKFCVNMSETGSIICGKPDLLVYNLRNRTAHIVEQKTAPVFDNYSPFVRRAAIQLAMYSWLFNEYYSGGIDWLKAYIVIIRYSISKKLQAKARVIPLFIRLSNNIRDLMIDAYNALISKGLVTVDECRLAKLIYGEYADCGDSGTVLIGAPSVVVEVNRKTNNLLFKRWRGTPNNGATTKEGVLPQ
jgi:hypothetical protein